VIAEVFQTSPDPYWLLPLTQYNDDVTKSGSSAGEQWLAVSDRIRDSTWVPFAAVDEVVDTEFTRCPQDGTFTCIARELYDNALASAPSEPTFDRAGIDDWATISEAIEAAVSVTLGEPAPDEASTWLTIFSIAATLVGVCLVGVRFSYVAAVVMVERLEERMGRRARRLKDHVVIVGLATVGYRVVQLPQELDIPVSSSSGSRSHASSARWHPRLRC
jgi:hypothetical protein